MATIVALFTSLFRLLLMIYGEQYISSGLASIIFANITAVMLMSGFIPRPAIGEASNLRLLDHRSCQPMSNPWHRNANGGDDHLIGTWFV